MKEVLLTQKIEKNKKKLQSVSVKSIMKGIKMLVNHQEMLRKRLKQDISARSASTTTKLGLEIDLYLEAETAEEKQIF